ncbi:C-terminal helicase domain-containing protein [Microlunatus capsulatus]|uniref:Helicase C-terminal domain-containing protein n=1 Tax=Microlunatus capsulatus TaxID=99117 RepID=A0ABS4Z760_9ACTN|nr:helicase-related protein [Microlunatus capsulatus]MBP2416882.1 hypothetical protein [Microlunatus capsulatus]
MTHFDAAPILDGLKDFQRATVEHVVDRFYGDFPTKRFLVADETGLGKSVVARGVVARVIERLQDDSSVDRIDIVYVCSNFDIARQNLKRLDVTGGSATVSTTRLTLLARDARTFQGAADVAATPVNVIAFTPGTSFSSGWATGHAEERALLYVMLAEACRLGQQQKNYAVTLLRATATRKGFEGAIANTRRALDGPPDEGISNAFWSEVQRRGLDVRFLDLLQLLIDKRAKDVSNALWPEVRRLISDLRQCLARASVERLEPDLVIFDEFQRFRHLMDPEQGGESAELAEALYDHRDTRLLLLSATPYKPFTSVEESSAGEDHYKDFRQTLGFLAQDEDWDREVDRALADYRRSLLTGDDADGPPARERVRRLLLQVMSRTERPTLGEVGEATGVPRHDGMLREHMVAAEDLLADDLVSYVAMRQLATTIDAHMSLDYWKSAPYFLNFAESYQIGQRIKERLKQRDVGELLSSLSLIDRHAVGRFDDIGLGNARLRAVAAQTVDAGWWKLLWMPPSMPYVQLEEPFGALRESGITKRLVFSGWNATPAAVASLISYEVERHLMGGRGLENDPLAIRNATRRLALRFDQPRPNQTAIALFWPQPELAELCDPLVLARSSPGFLSSTAATAYAESLIAERVKGNDGEAGASAAELALRWPLRRQPDAGSLPGGDDSVDDDTDLRGWDRAMEETFQLERRPASAADVERESRDLAALALFAPGNAAWRAVSRLLGESDSVTLEGRWRAALTIATGLRTLFQRPESVLVIEQGVGENDAGDSYWRQVLAYCAAGDLQAVLDEYLHHLRSEKPSGPLDDETLLQLATSASDVLSLRAVTLRAFDPHAPADPITLRCRFALRYGAREGTGTDQVRASEVRAAFNSPFWPFVMATTSAGQEGIDFHWWCSAVIHWNTPSNPVDFEQREGRVHRFGGHAVRRNVAAAHRHDVLASSDADPWRAAYDAALAASGDLGEFSPYWVFPGAAKIERHVLPYPLSRDLSRYEQLKVDLATYRLAFGQPRQEDMLELMKRRGTTQATEPLDLRPPPGAAERDNRAEPPEEMR